MGTKRERIGIVYNPSSDWIAGAYYVQNIVLALKKCSDEKQPIISVYCSNQNDFEELRKITGYPYLRIRLTTPPKTYFYRFLKYHIPWLKELIFGDSTKFPTRRDKVKFIYPISYFDAIEDRSKVLGWIPDFQEKYLPELFKQEDIDGRQNQQKAFVDTCTPVVFSSKDARNDFLHFYPDGKQCKTFVLPFAVTHPDYTTIEIAAVKEKYGIKKPYLFCANQFWMHKNHLFLFNAFAKARQSGLDLQLVCSGKLSEYRDSEYSKKILDFISNNHLEEDILILGFIDRKEQLCLMKNSYAMVQPSLFEGWSTVVEDAKRLNKFIFLSDLRVHIEQAPMDVCYFNPREEHDLVEKLLTVQPTCHPFDYEQEVKKMGESFVNIIEQF